MWNRFAKKTTGYFRKRRAQKLVKLFPEIRQMKICDLGGSQHFWISSELDIPTENITIYNIREGDTGALDAKKSSLRIKKYDGKNIPAGPKEFDLLICNSVIEHVAPAERSNLIKEMRRVAKRVYLQTPAYEFPIDPHFVMPFIHWLPRGLGFMVAKVSPWRIMSRPSPESVRSYFWNTNLLSKTGLQKLIPDAQIDQERFLGMTKSYLATF